MIPRSPGPGTRLRLDPCTSAGEIRVRRIRVEAIQRPPATGLRTTIHARRVQR